jgi:hypothetical protein
MQCYIWTYRSEYVVFADNIDAAKKILYDRYPNKTLDETLFDR